MLKKKKKISDHLFFDIPARANRVLNVIFILLILLAIRVWYLSIIQHDKRLLQAQGPQQRYLIERGERATIRDRFDIPLVLNKVQYNASVLYQQILQIPRLEIKQDSSTGLKKRIYKRKKYIEELSKCLSHYLNLDAERIEDYIYSRAAIFPNVPFVLQSNIDESTFFQLKLLEKDWLGVQAEISPQRYYPQEKVAGSILGYMGAISKPQLDSFIKEKKELEFFLNQEDRPVFYKGLSHVQAKQRLQEIKEKSYSMNDFVGKSGIEKECEEALRGSCGKTLYHTNARGHFLEKLSESREPKSGNRVILSISSELQAYAERLLAQNEKLREGASRQFNFTKRHYEQLKQPIIKGGAIVALDPNNGEVIALASYPRFDPNDFIQSGRSEDDWEKRNRKFQWLETRYFIEKLWNQEVRLIVEESPVASDYVLEKKIPLTWGQYLKFILPLESPVIQAVHHIKDVRQTVSLQRSFKFFQAIFSEKNPLEVMNILYHEGRHKTYKDTLSWKEKQQYLTHLRAQGNDFIKHKNTLDMYLTDCLFNYDKLMVLDLTGLLVKENLFSDSLLHLMGSQSLYTLRSASGAYANIRKFVYEQSKTLFEQTVFKLWRKKRGKTFLKSKRKIEKENKRYAKPYLYYFDKEKNRLFNIFWKKNKDYLITCLMTGENQFSGFINNDKSLFMKHFQQWHHELKHGAHRHTVWFKHYGVLLRAIKKLGPVITLDYFSTLREFDDLSKPLLGYYPFLSKKKPIEKDLASAFYPRYGYKFARSYAFQQATTQGSVFKLVTAYVSLIQKYLEQGEDNLIQKDLNPLTMIDRVHRKSGRNSPWIVGYTLSGEPIPQYYKGGRILKSLRRNIGRIDLLKALQTSSNTYFALLAGDYLKQPELLNSAAKVLGFGDKTGIDLPGEYKGKLPKDLVKNRSGLYSYACGQHTLVVTPLQTAVMLSTLANGGKVFKPSVVKEIKKGKVTVFTCDSSSQVKREIYLPDPVRYVLIKGMKQAVMARQESDFRNYYDNLQLVHDYNRYKQYIVGKTSTAENVEKIDLDFYKGTNLYNHLWFGAISFEKGSNHTIHQADCRQPELVIVVYLRYGNYGKEAAPIAVQMIKKWRELKHKYQTNL